MSHLSFTIPVPKPFSLRQTLRLSTLGGRDPASRLTPQTAELCWNSPAGPVSLRAQHREDHLGIDLWGPGANWLQPKVSSALGLNDSLEGFTPTGSVLQLVQRLPGTYLPRLPVLFDRLIQTVLQQLVSWDDAVLGWRSFVRTFGQPAPGPVELRLPPTPDRLNSLAYFDLVACGILPRQARLILQLAREERRLERLAEDSPARCVQRLRSIPGIGPWTIQYLRGTALGEPDAVLVGDYALPHAVAWHFRQKPRSSDEEMLELLEPWKGHRFRVQHLLLQSGITAPRRGSKMKTNRQRFGL